MNLLSNKQTSVIYCIVHMYLESDCREASNPTATSMNTILGLTVSLPRGGIQEIKRMLLVHLSHSFFLTWTQKSHILQIVYYNIYTSYNASFNPTPCSQPFRVYFHGEPTSLLIAANTNPLLSLVGQQLPHPLLVLPPLHTPQIKLQYLHRRHQQHQPSSSGTLTIINISNEYW